MWPLVSLLSSDLFPPLRSGGGPSSCRQTISEGVTDDVMGHVTSHVTYSLSLPHDDANEGNDQEKGQHYNYYDDGCYLTCREERGT